MRFDLSGESHGEWFRFFKSEVKENGEIVYAEPENGAGRVCIRLGDPKTIGDIQAKTRVKKSEFVVNPTDRKMERVVYYDQTDEQARKEQELVWDYAIQEWEGILDKNGNDVPCTAENKLKLMGIPVFARFVHRCLRMMVSANAAQGEIEGKNL